MMGQYIPMNQIFTWRQWKLFKRYQIKFAEEPMDARRFLAQLEKVDKLFKIMIIIAELTLVSFAIFQGIYISYLSFTDLTIEELTPEQSRFLL